VQKINTLTILIFILGAIKIFSQNVDISNFFPYKTGDMWEYFFDAGGPDVDTVQTITISDSTDQEGKILGEEVSTLVNGVKYPGNYETEFDASQLSSGVYFTILQTLEARLTRSLLLIK
jgi:hypothetical protein